MMAFKVGLTDVIPKSGHDSQGKLQTMLNQWVTTSTQDYGTQLFRLDRTFSHGFVGLDHRHCVGEFLLPPPGSASGSIRTYPLSNELITRGLVIRVEGLHNPGPSVVTPDDFEGDEVHASWTADWSEPVPDGWSDDDDVPTQPRPSRPAWGDEWVDSDDSDVLAAALEVEKNNPDSRDAAVQTTIIELEDEEFEMSGATALASPKKTKVPKAKAPKNPRSNKGGKGKISAVKGRRVTTSSDSQSPNTAEVASAKADPDAGTSSRTSGDVLVDSPQDSPRRFGAKIPKCFRKR
jgi:hypothetical protein